LSKEFFFIETSQRIRPSVESFGKNLLMNQISRRALLTGIVGAGLATGLAGCGVGDTKKYLGASSILAREESLLKSGKVQLFNLTAKLNDIDLGGVIAKTWTYDDSFPGKIIRANVGDRLKVNFRNQLPDPTSVHWHGLAIRNDMDGVPGLTTPEVAPNGAFNFDFTLPDSGTYWFHPHSGTQLDRGLYAPLIVDDPNEIVQYDQEWIAILDDWSDGVGKNPDEILADLLNGSGISSGMEGMDHGGNMGNMSDMGGMSDMDAGDVTYPMYLINGRPINDPEVFKSKPGQRIRIRIINAAADTIFNVALSQHKMVVTHTDGFPVKSYPTDSLRIGMGERYDVVVTIGDGVFVFVADAIGKSAIARALIRSGSGPVPEQLFRPAELDTKPLTADLLLASEQVKLPSRKSDRTQDLILQGSMQPYKWTINGRTYDKTKALVVRLDEISTLRIRNRGMMYHPIHLHGHTFQLGAAGENGARKDTVLIPPMGGINVDFAATNPGKWMIHCHNAYHAEAGMMTRLEYIA